MNIIDANSLSTADLVDAHGDKVRSCTVAFRQFGARARFFGRVRTLKTFEDNALIKQTLSSPGDGAVRDSVALGGLDLGIKALGTNLWKSSKLGGGAVDVPVSFGGVEFRAGEWLYGDEDGILVRDVPL
jgi:regulator of ribonuclease activity A